MYHPSTENDLEEYIELFNRGDVPVDLSGWRINDGIEFTFPDVTIGIGDYLVVAADPDTFTAKYPTVMNVVGGWNRRLSNKGERIQLVDDTGTTIEQIRYADQGDWGERWPGPLDHGHYGWIWSAAHDGAGSSLELINPAMPRVYGANWSSSLTEGGTPGSENSVHATDIAPIIADVIHHPIIPSSSDWVTVTTRIIDELETGLAVTLNCRVDGATDFVTISMMDDGINGDQEPGDGIYSAKLAPLPSGTIVEFYVHTSDAANNTRTWPAPTRPSGDNLTNALYLVDDTLDLAAQSDPDSQPVYYLIMTEAERAEIQDIGNGVDEGTEVEEHDSNAQMNGTFISVEGPEIRLRYTVGIRNRGEGTRSVPPNNYRVNFRHDRLWHGMSSLNINSNYPHSQILGSALFQFAGLAAANAVPVQVRVNGVNLAQPGGRMFGTYAAVEPLNGEFAASHFPDDDDGNLYRGRYSADLFFAGTDPDAYRSTYTKETNEELDDWSDLIHLLDVLNNTPEESFLQEVEQVVNIDQWVRYFALDSLLGNLEGGLGTGRGDDYAIYRGTVDTRFILVPHDLDTLMGRGRTPQPYRNIFAYANVTGLRRLLAHPDVVARYYGQFVELTETIYKPEIVEILLDQHIGGFVPQSEIDEMTQFVADRIDGVLAQFSLELTAGCELPLSGQYYVSTRPTVAVEGLANPIETRSVLVNGTLAEWVPTDSAWFTGEVFVRSGSLWKYLDDGSDQGTLWRSEDFDDSLWPSGHARLGYGGNGETTLIGFGPDPANKYVTTYFRRSFDVEDISTVTALTLRLLRDDGAVVYLNGTEIARSNMPGNPGQDEVNYRTFSTTWASDANETTFFTFPVDPGLLRSGRNVLAAEVHQANLTSSDLSFDLELVAQKGVTLDPGPNNIIIQTFDDYGGTGTELESSSIDIWYEQFNSGGQYEMDMIVRDSYISGLPVLVRIEVVDGQGNIARDLWDALVTLSVDQPDVQLSTSQIVMYNGLGSAMVTVTGSSDFTLTATLGDLSTNRTLVSLTNVPTNEASGVLTGEATTWTGVVHVTGNVLVPAGHTLTIEPGTLVLVDGMSPTAYGLDIDVEGTVRSLGTAARPVTITASDSGVPWGEIHHNHAEDSVYQYTHITRAGNSPGGGHTGAGPAIRSSGAPISFYHSAITDISGKIMTASGSDLTFTDSLIARAVMGPEIDTSALLFENSWITEMPGVSDEDDNDGIYIHRIQSGQTVVFRGGVMASGADDGLDTLDTFVTVENYIFRDFADKGISVNVGEVTVDRSLLVDNGVGISAKTMPVRVSLDHVTITGNGIGVQARDKYGLPEAVIPYFIRNSIIWGNDDDVQTDYDPADIHIDYSNVGEPWPGTGNLNMDPLFTYPANHDYNLHPGSPSIDAGDPAAETDDDGSRTDQGCCQFITSTNGNGTSGDIDGDGVVDAIDIQLTVNEVLGIISAYNCDVNDDGVVDSLDLQLVINMALGVS